MEGKGGKWWLHAGYIAKVPTQPYIEKVRSLLSCNPIDRDNGRGSRPKENKG